MSDDQPAEAPDEQPRPGPAGSADEPDDQPVGEEPEGARPGLPAWIGTREPAGRTSGKRRRRRVVVGAGLAVVLGWWSVRAVAADGPARTPAETVTAFFDAQRAGDCELLVDLLTESSWSQDGTLTRDGFVDACGEALAGYRPVPGPVTIELVVDGERYGSPTEDEADRALVRIGGLRYEAPEGTLVREGGAWRIETDERVLVVGGSAAERLQRYVDAYDAGDCERMRLFLAEPTCSQDRTLSEDEFADRCARAVGRAAGDGDGADRRPLVVDAMTIGFRQSDRSVPSVAVTVHRDGELPLEDHSDEATFVREGLVWQLVGLPEGATDTVVPVFEWVELQDVLVDEVVRPDDDCTSYQDVEAAQPAGDPQTSGVTRDFSSCFLGVNVSLRSFPDDAAAREAAEDLVDRELSDLPPTAADLADSFPERDPSELERAADSYRPSVEAPVPGIDGALGVRTSCSVSGCSGASAHAIRDGLLVSVEVQYGDPDMAVAAATVAAQLERL